MDTLPQLFDNNRKWAASMEAQDPGFFARLSLKQTPEYLWIGCSDSRVPPNQILGLLPGEIFVHRNIANVVVQTDLSCLSVMQYAVEALKVKHIIVCGHYSCGGVLAALQNQKLGLIDNWLRHVQDVRQMHREEIASLPDEAAQARRLCELNVQEQVANVCRSTVVQSAWARGQEVAVHGWIYDLASGLLRKVQDPVKT